MRNLCYVLCDSFNGSLTWNSPYENLTPMIKIIFIALFALPTLSYAKPLCVVVKNTSKAIHETSKEKIRVYSGESFPYIKRNKGRTAVQGVLGDNKFWFSRKKVQGRKLKSCIPNLCVLIPEKNTVSKSPNGPSLEVQPGLKKIISTSIHSRESWYRLEEDGSFFWLDQQNFNKYQVSCTEKFNEANIDFSKNTQTPKQKESSWQYGFEVGYIYNHSAKSIQNLLTPIPPSNTDVNDEAYDSPFIEEIREGRGFNASAFIETPFLWGLKNKIMLGYTSRTLDYTSRPNPQDAATPVINYDQLAKEDVQLNFQSIHLNIMPKYPFEIWGLGVHLGLGLRMQYYFQKTAVEFLTSPQKQTSYLVETGHSSFEVELVPRIEVHWEPVYFFIETNNSLSPDVELSFDPAFGLGIQF